MDKNVFIAETAEVSKTSKFGNGVTVEDGVKIGDNTIIGNFVVIKEDTQIGSNVRIEDHVVLGKNPQLGKSSTVKKEILSPLIIESDVKISCFSCVYAGSVISKGVIIGDTATVRERVEIGEDTVIGRGVCVENDTKIGKETRVQTGAYITAYTVLEDSVFIAPMVTTTNDNFMGRTEKRFKYMKGPTVKFGARVGANSILLPGIVIGREAFVAAGSVVTRDVPSGKLVMGVPAKAVRDVAEDELLENQ